ncbi:MAG: hypothetical protein Fur0023_17930 [Bacteroidia bacterium]
MKRKYNIPLFTILLIGWLQHFTHAQVNKLMEAFDCYQNKNFTCAKNKIDSVVLHPETKEEPAAWSLRAYIYYQYFKMYEYKLYNSPYREISAESAQKSQSLSPDAETENNNKRLLKTIAESYFNQIKIYLYDSLSYTKSVELYNNYKKLYQTIDPSFNFKDKDVEFYNSVGGQFVTTIKKLFDSNTPISETTFNEYNESAKVSFNKVLEIDPNNSAALEGLAIAYYNQGTMLIKEMSYDTPIEQIEQIQENANKYFKQALPYMQKAYSNKPNDINIITGLAGIYYAIHDNEKYIEFKKILDKLNKEKQQK